MNTSQGGLVGSCCVGRRYSYLDTSPQDGVGGEEDEHAVGDDTGKIDWRSITRHRCEKTLQTI
jgi:hypothetical protein